MSEPELSHADKLGTEKSAGLAVSPFVRIALGVLWLYKRTLSPILYFFGVRCRHEPGCSDYSVEAFKRFGAWRGFWMTLARFGRCHPLGTHGFDPVPEEQPEASLKVWRFGRWR